MPNASKNDDLLKRTKELALRIIRLCASLPQNNVGKIISYQLLKSGTSVGANYHEAARARSRAEFLSKTGDSFRELSETRYWLELLSESHTITPQKLTSLLSETDQLSAIFYTIIKKTRLTNSKNNLKNPKPAA